MKMSYLFIAVALAVLSVSAVFVMSSDGSDAATGDYTDGDFTFNVVNGNATIVSYTGTNATTVNIPATVSDGTNTYNVTILGDGTTHIMDDAQLSTDGYTVVIPNSVITLSDYSFAYLRHMLSVTIPDSVTSIGTYAFRECGLTNIVIPDSVVNVDVGLCANCYYLESVTYSGNLTTIPRYGFYNCSSLTTYTISENIVSVGDQAFKGCSGITKLTLYGSPTFGTDSLNMDNCQTVLNFGSTTINAGDYGLPATVNIQAITHTITDDYATITALNGNGWDLDYLPDYIIDNGVSYPVEVIGDGTNPVITNAQLVEGANLVIPDTVLTISDRALHSLFKLVSVDLGNVQTIGENAFNTSYGIVSLTIPDSVVSIGDRAFNNMTHMTTLDLGEGVQTIGNMAFNNAPLIETLVIPDSVVSIGHSGFNYCYGLRGTLIIPESVQSLGQAVFADSGFDSLVILGTPTIDENCFKTDSIKNVLNLGSLEITTTSYGLNADEVRDDVPGNMYVAPVHVRDVQKDGDVYNILVIIPLMLIVGLLIFGIYAMRGKY